jgi:hypothetical protein
MSERIKRERLSDAPAEDEGIDGERKRTIPLGWNGNPLVRSAMGRPRGQPNETTRQVSMAAAPVLGLKRGQSLSTARVKQGLSDVVAFLGYYQSPTEEEITEFLGDGGGGLKGFILRTALTRRGTFERWFERALIPQKIQADIDATSRMARMLQVASAARAAREQGSGGNGSLIDLQATRIAEAT